MSHVHRVRTSDRIFFITVNLRRKLARLAGEEFALLTNALVESRRKLHFQLLGYVLMPDHWHALIWPAYPLTISRVVQDVKWISATGINHSHHSSGTAWQHQFWDRFVRHEREFNQRLDYMHWNPVRKGLAKKPEDWRWSSYNNFAVDGNVAVMCPIQIDYIRLPQGYQA